MISLRLALRGLAARVGLTVSLLAVTSFAVAVASAGAMYLRAAGESVLQDALRSAPPSASGVAVAQRVAGRREVRGLDRTVRAAMPALPALEPPVTGFDTTEPTALARPGADVPGEERPTAKLASRSGLCQHLVVLRGRCPGPTALDAPAEAAISDRAAAKLHMGVGDRLDAGLVLGANGVAREAKVVAVYRPTQEDPWWWGHDLFYNPAKDTEVRDAPLDAVLLDDSAMQAVVGGAADVTARWDFPLEARRVRLRDAPGLALAVGDFRGKLAEAYPQAALQTGLPSLVERAEEGRQALTVPVLLATVQLVALGLLILVVVAAMAAEARAGEVALAKVRGATTGQAFGLATLELALVAVAAVPGGLALGWLGTGLIARAQLVPGVPVVVTPLAVAAALAAGAVALAAAAAAGLGAVRRRVLDQWRQARSDRVGRRSLLVEVVLLAVAAAALANLRTGGARPAGTYDPLAVLAPALVVLAGALVAGRVLPFVASVLVRVTARSRRLAPFIGARQVARRGGAALRVVVALAAAFGLVAFAVTVRQDMSRNRHDRAMTETGAARRADVGFPAGSLGPEQVRAADPSGRTAMAAFRYTGSLASSGREATVLGVQADRYQGIGFWRGDFAAERLGRLLAPLRRTPIPPLELGPATGLEVDLGVDDLRAAGPVTLVADVRGADGSGGPVLLGRLQDGPIRPYRAGLDPAVLRSDGPYQLRRLYLDRGVGRFFSVSATFRFDSVRVQQAGVWRVVESFDDPARWNPVNDGDYTPADELGSDAGDEGRATTVKVEAPSFATGIGLVHASVPRAVPAVVTPGFLSAESARVGQVVRVGSPTEGDIALRVTGVAEVLPGTGGAEVAALVDLDGLLAQALRNPNAQVSANQVWTSGGRAADGVLDRLRARGVEVEAVTAAADRERALAREAPSLALLLLMVGAAAGAVLATGGVMLHLYLTGRRRGFELAVLDALGARRRDLWAPVAVEQGSLVGYGVLVGGAVGLAAALVALPAIPQFLDRPEVPPPIYTPDWLALGGALGLALVVVALGLAAVVAGLVRKARPELLREEEA
ncbi:MAG TPA: FtsX-like permease family protein [Actinomycetes bacterium]|nr:FtsX-like permease family protein [Actinomycetes bacterium]